MIFKLSLTSVYMIFQLLVRSSLLYIYFLYCCLYIKVHISHCFVPLPVQVQTRTNHSKDPRRLKHCRIILINLVTKCLFIPLDVIHISVFLIQKITLCNTTMNLRRDQPFYKITLKFFHWIRRLQHAENKGLLK